MLLGLERAAELIAETGDVGRGLQRLAAGGLGGLAVDGIVIDGGRNPLRIVRARGQPVAFRHRFRREGGRAEK